MVAVLIGLFVSVGGVCVGTVGVLVAGPDPTGAVEGAVTGAEIGAGDCEGLAVPKFGFNAGAFVPVIGAYVAFAGAGTNEGTRAIGAGANGTFVGCSVVDVDEGAFCGPRAPNGTLVGIAVTAVGVLFVIGAAAEDGTIGALGAPTGVFAGAATVAVKVGDGVAREVTGPVVLLVGA
jgi:hypothetical protein